MDYDIAQTILLEAKTAWGAGWDRLSSEQQKAAVSQALVTHLMRSRVTPGTPLEEFQMLALITLQLVV